MKVYLFILPIIVMISIAYAQEEKPFIYEDTGLADPFLPLVAKDGKIIMASGTIRSINDVVLEGIVYDPDGDSVVILNGLILKENDRVGKIRVKKINDSGVILIFNEKEYPFKLKE